MGGFFDIRGSENESGVAEGSPPTWSKFRPQSFRGRRLRSGIDADPGGAPEPDPGGASDPGRALNPNGSPSSLLGEHLDEHADSDADRPANGGAEDDFQAVEHAPFPRLHLARVLSGERVAVHVLPAAERQHLAVGDQVVLLLQALEIGERDQHDEQRGERERHRGDRVPAPSPFELVCRPGAQPQEHDCAHDRDRGEGVVLLDRLVHYLCHGLNISFDEGVHGHPEHVGKQKQALDVRICAAALPVADGLARHVDPLRQIVLGKAELRAMLLDVRAQLHVRAPLGFGVTPVESHHGIDGQIVPSKVFMTRRRRVKSGCQKALYTAVSWEFSIWRSGRGWHAAVRGSRRPAWEGLNGYLADLVAVEFRKRFESNVPTVELGDVLSISMKTLKPQDHGGEIWEHYSIPSYDENRRPVFEQACCIKSNKYLIDSECILISKLNPSIKRIWMPACTSGRAVCSTEFIVYRPNNPEHRSFYYAAIDTPEFTDYLLAHVTGSTGSRQRTQPKATLAYPMQNPGNASIDDFCKFADPLYQQIQMNELESIRMEELRDALLPKLMSGEIDVSKVDLTQLNSHLADRLPLLAGNVYRLHGLFLPVRPLASSLLLEDQRRDYSCRMAQRRFWRKCSPS